MSLSKRIGIPALLEQSAEECVELAHALLKEARRLRGENPTPKSEEECYASIEEELGDVFICITELSQAGYLLDMPTMRSKRERWSKRIKEMEDKNDGKYGTKADLC